MTHEQEILARSMSRIDDDIILSAHAPRQKAYQRFGPLAVACLVVVLSVSFLHLYEILGDQRDLKAPEASGQGNNYAAADMDKEEDFYAPSEESPMPWDRVRLTLLELTDTVATFSLIKTDDTPAYMTLCDASGEVLASTQIIGKDESVTSSVPMISLCVDYAEESVYVLPTQAGTYEIQADLTVVLDENMSVGDLTLEVYACVEEGAILPVFSLPLETPSNAEDGDTAGERAEAE